MNTGLKILLSALFFPIAVPYWIVMMWLKKWMDIGPRIFLTVLGSFFVVVFIATNTTSSKKVEVEKVAETQQPKVEATIAPTIIPSPTVELTKKQMIEKKITDAAGSDLQKIDVIEEKNGSYEVHVDMKMVDNLTTKLIKHGMSRRGVPIMRAAFSDADLKVSGVILSYIGKLTDKYGNESDGVVYQILLTSGEGGKVNWSKSDLDLQSLLPDVWLVSQDHFKD